LAAPVRQWRPFAWPLAVLALLPLWSAVGWLTPLGVLLKLTALLSRQWLELCGFSESQQGLFLYLPGGGVKVAGACGQFPSTAIAAGGQSRRRTEVAVAPNQRLVAARAGTIGLETEALSRSEATRKGSAGAGLGYRA
jgi:hypothetical protein